MTTLQKTLVFVLVLLSTASPAFGADLAGSRDHPLVPRYEGSVILAYDQAEYDGYTLPLGPAQGDYIDKLELTSATPLEGRVTRITYLAPAGRSALEVFDNYAKSLAAAGFEPLFEGAGTQLGGGIMKDPRFFAYAAGYKSIKLPGYSVFPLADVPASEKHNFLAARLRRAEGDVHVAVYAIESSNPSITATLYADPNTPTAGGVAERQVIVQLDVVEARAMETRMVTVKADEMASGLAAAGSVSLYGILFDTNSATVKAESADTLAEIGKLMASRADLQLLVVGHTDNVGEFEFNRDLSQRRAAAVVDALATGHGVARSRLTPFGVSFSSPKASNRTEEGRAKNRRVEIVER